MDISKDSLLALIEASLHADYSGVRKAANNLAQSISNTDNETAKRIKSLIRRKGVPLKSSGYTETLPNDPKSRLPLIEEVSWPVTPVFLDELGKNVFDSFIADIKNIDKLLLHGLAGKSNMLLSGPPGTGKTLIAGHIAAQLGRPLYVVRLDSVISSLLGDTAKNLRSVFDFVPEKGGVLFLDEVDAVAKLRDDRHEVGELKRVVNTLIQGLDSLDDSAVVLAATNHSGLLDPAIWRRFPYKINFELPNHVLRKSLWEYFLFQDHQDESTADSLAKISEGLSGADIESISFAARRRAVIESSKLHTPRIAQAILESHTGNTRIPFASEIKSHDKKTLSKVMYEEHSLSKAEIARVLGVSRQAVSSYLKE